MKLPLAVFILIPSSFIVMMTMNGKQEKGRERCKKGKNKI